MSRNYYSEIHLHMVRHTKESSPLLTPAVEVFTHDYLRQRVVRTPGAYVHAIGGTANHVHLAITIPPTLLISDFIGQLKGSSAHEANQQVGRMRMVLEWQAGYGVVSFGTRNLNWVIAYIRNQKEHHAQGTIVDRLERIIEEEAAQAESRQAP